MATKLRGKMNIKCAGCGRFVSLAEMQDDSAVFHFEPDSHFGPEVSEWVCAACAAKDRQEQRQSLSR
jgi:hypothetical protein